MYKKCIYVYILKYIIKRSHIKKYVTYLAGYEKDIT